MRIWWAGLVVVLVGSVTAACSPTSPVGPTGVAAVVAGVLGSDGAVLDGVVNSAQSTGDGGVVASTPGLSVTLPGDPKAGIALGLGADGAVTLGLPFADVAARASAVRTGVVAYDNRNGSVTSPVITDHGVSVTTLIQDASAPSRYEYPLTLPPESRIELDEDETGDGGGVSMIGADGELVLSIGAPWAQGADGHEVSTHFEVDGDRLTQVIDHTAAGTVYPVLADPSIARSIGGKISDQFTAVLDDAVAVYTKYKCAIEIGKAFLPASKVYRAVKEAGGARKLAAIIWKNRNSIEALKQLYPVVRSLLDIDSVVSACFPEGTATNSGTVPVLAVPRQDVMSCTAAIDKASRGFKKTTVALRRLGSRWQVAEHLMRMDPANQAAMRDYLGDAKWILTNRLVKALCFKGKSPAPTSSVALDVSAGNDYACALMIDHTVQCWGFNGNGQLGPNAPSSTGVPVTIPGVVGATAISTGSESACAVLNSGRVKCWGRVNVGQPVLNPYELLPPIPPTLMPGVTNAVSISGGQGNGTTCAVLADRTVSCWGRNVHGELGDPALPVFIDSRFLPRAVPGLTGVTQVTVGTGSVCAVSDAVYCWGIKLGEFPAFGGFEFDLVRSPAVVLGTTGASAVGLGIFNGCLTRSGTVWCFGYNGLGELGLADRTAHFGVVEGLNGTERSLASGMSESCAVTTSRTVKCWGGDFGGLGYGPPPYSTPYPAPGAVTVPGLNGAENVSIGGSHNVCAVTDLHRVSCWGAIPGSGLGGVGPTEINFSLAPAVDTDGDAVGDPDDWCANEAAQAGSTTGCPIGSGPSLSDIRPLNWTDRNWVVQAIAGTSFTNPSEADFAWDFGDGKPTVHGSDVQHQYTSAGSYAISLTVVGPYGRAQHFDTAVTIDGDPMVDFAPEVRLDSREQNFPMNPADFIARSKLMWNRCQAPLDNVVVADPALSARLGKNGLNQYTSPARCTTAVPYVASKKTRPFEGGRDPELDGGEGFNLDFDRLAPPPEPAPIPVWYEAGPKPGADPREPIVVTYWFFYGYNNSPGGALGDLVDDHEGDWEQINVNLNPATRVPVSVNYFGHGTPGAALYFPAVQRSSFFHPIVFSAVGSHASYSDAGNYPLASVGGLVSDQADGGGAIWQTWTSGVFDVTTKDWYGFGGAWGEAGIQKHTTGPMGPSPHKNRFA